MSRTEWSIDGVNYDKSTCEYRTVLDSDSSMAVSTAVSLLVEDVADCEGYDLDWQLYESVDPDALDALFSPTKRTPRTDGTLMLSAGPIEVRVGGDGTIVVRTDDCNTP